MSPTSPRIDGADTERGQRHRGPSLLALALVFAGLFIGSLVVVAAMTHGGHFPSPFEPIAATNAFFAENRDALQLGAFLQFGASVPLAIFAATASSRLRFLGIEAAGTLITSWAGFSRRRWEPSRLSLSGLSPNRTLGPRREPFICSHSVPEDLGTWSRSDCSSRASR
jgi:hypothetical protein